MDQTTGLGPTSQYGQRAMMPISWGIDNRAFAGVVDGIGSARAKIRARKGAEPGIASQYRSLDDIRRDGIYFMYMPLQLPMDGLDYKEARPISVTKGLVDSLKSFFGDSETILKLWRVDAYQPTKLVPPIGRGSTVLYSFRKDEEENSNKLLSAINYTKALMQASLSIKLSSHSHRIDTDRPQVRDEKIESFSLGKEEKTNKEVFYKVMMCSFILKSRHKGSDVGDDTQGEIDRIMADKDQKTTKPTTEPAKKTNEEV